MSFDPLSSDFDPEAALRFPEKVILPNPDIKPYNNVAEYVSRTRGMGRARGPRPGNMIPTTTSRGQSSRASTSKMEDSRSWIRATLTDKPEPKIWKDVLNLMPTKKGPLAFLHKCVLNKTKVKVWTRNFTNIRGICTGFLVVFDKHWNLALKDVDETFIRPLKRKTPPMGPLQLITKPFTKTGRVIDASETTPDSLEPKGKWVKRHVPQLFIRGDNVVMVAAVT